jgi:hypothetical protein
MLWLPARSGLLCNQAAVKSPRKFRISVASSTRAPRSARGRAPIYVLLASQECSYVTGEVYGDWRRFLAISPQSRLDLLSIEPVESFYNKSAHREPL